MQDPTEVALLIAMGVVAVFLIGVLCGALAFSNASPLADPERRTNTVLRQLIDDELAEFQAWREECRYLRREP